MPPARKTRNLESARSKRKGLRKPIHTHVHRTDVRGARVQQRKTAYDIVALIIIAEESRNRIYRRRHQDPADTLNNNNDNSTRVL